VTEPVQDLLGALVAHLRAQEVISDVAADRVFGLELPPEEAESMPRSALVLSPAGGAALGYTATLPLQGVRVDAIMVKSPRTMGPNVEVDELRSVMLEHHIRYMPVVENDALIGLLAFHDVARAVLEEQAFENRMLKGYIKDSPA